MCEGDLPESDSLEGDLLKRRAAITAARADDLRSLADSQQKFTAVKAAEAAQELRERLQEAVNDIAHYRSLVDAADTHSMSELWQGFMQRNIAKFDALNRQ